MISRASSSGGLTAELSKSTFRSFLQCTSVLNILDIIPTQDSERTWWTTDSFISLQAWIEMAGTTSASFAIACSYAVKSIPKEGQRQELLEAKLSPLLQLRHPETPRHVSINNSSSCKCWRVCINKSSHTRLRTTRSKRRPLLHTGFMFSSERYHLQAIERGYVYPDITTIQLTSTA